MLRRPFSCQNVTNVTDATQKASERVHVDAQNFASMDLKNKATIEIKAPSAPKPCEGVKCSWCLSSYRSSHLICLVLSEFPWFCSASGIFNPEVEECPLTTPK